eukprot:CAMPEP_0183516814 /NCGR_PEP_ID=MMETSP0371-20130417/14463_1 /TAXON_ID=268820 /ORGANISM="Peridinium aciculiferum, Strain PAER-2" /LENGTH=83 /DNA_ID=CAMNT_0025714607 /DNA_START=167 /DNA_END=416 /DNA_ORIENTATION=-
MTVAEAVGTSVVVPLGRRAQDLPGALRVPKGDSASRQRSSAPSAAAGPATKKTTRNQADIPRASSRKHTPWRELDLLVHFGLE